MDLVEQREGHERPKFLGTLYDSVITIYPHFSGSGRSFSSTGLLLIYEAD